MIVLITSCDPKRAFNTPGMAPQTAPESTAARKHDGSRIQAGSDPSVIPTQAVTNAAT